MSAPTRPADRAARAGLSLIEMLVVLAILALATAVVMPGAGRMLDQATAHAVFFEFQREVSDLRREANRTGLPIRLVEVRPEGLSRAAGPDDRTVEIRAPWRYTLAPPLEIAGGGVCAPASANLLHGDRVVMTLRSDGPDCRFIRLLPAAERPRGSSSRTPASG